jgi:glycosyltransferase involved in cell wall biosynthesis
MRIGYDARLAWRRGVGTYTANLLLALARMDSYNEYFVFSAPQELRNALPTGRFHFIDPSDKTSPRLLRPLLRHPAVYEQLWMPAMLARHELDILHFTDNSATVASGIPFVVTIHDTMFLRPIRKVYTRPTIKQWLIDRYKKITIPAGAQAALGVITVSEASACDIIRDLGIAKDRVWITPEGVDMKEFHRSARSGRRREGATVLVHGAEDGRKNLENVLRCASLLQKKMSVCFRIIGMDETRMKRIGLMGMIRENALGSRVVLSGDVDREKLIQAYHRSDVLLHVSRWEGFGLPVLEAFACGLPVVVSNAKSLPEVAGNAALIVSPDSPQEMADALWRVLSGPALSRSLVRKGVARARQFTWEKTALKTLEAYRRARLNSEYDTHGRRIDNGG